jgi:PPM family protein phosphatase
MLKVAEEAHKTDTGRQRQANEDSYFARAPLFAVADGMGGAQAGEVASRIAARAFERRRSVSDEEPAEGQLEEIAQEANREIHKLAQEDSSRAGMGTTLTAALLRDDEVALGHVGDSRAYLLRGGRLKRLTKDHSLVEELRRQGRLTEEQAEEHPQRSIITRALGPEPSVNVDTMTFPARDGDVFLLCSDGLTTMVSDDQIRTILVNSKSLRSAVSRLIEAANRGGGRDNITAVAFRVADADAQEDEEGATLISRTAEQAGLTGERMRAATDRMRGQGRVPTPSRRKRVLKWVAAAVVVAAVVAGAVLFARSIYFLGTDDQGNVAVYRGLPYELPLGVSLYSKQYSIPVQEGTLSEERQKGVTGHDLRSKEDAADFANDINQREGAAQRAAAAQAAQRAAKQQAQQRKQGANRKKKQAQKR